MEVVRNHFRPEFINRLDDVVMFSPLGTEQLIRIVDLQLDALQQRLEDRRLTLDVSLAAKEWLCSHGFDPIYGARPLRRWCRRQSAMRWRRRSWLAQSSTVPTVSVEVSEDLGSLIVRPARRTSRVTQPSPLGLPSRKAAF